jgi:endonuclease/exonuclease/phosphatase family metal-dependent hydrolase
VKKVLKPVFLAAAVTILTSSIFTGTQHAAAQEKSNEITELDLEVMTYNLRYKNTSDPSPHTWAERVPAIKRLINQEKPDIMGTQEVLYPQLLDLEEALPKYDWIGLGREGGSKGEYSAIFYNKSRYTPIEYDHFWLSDTPNVIGSMTWGNKITRMVTWAKFEDKKTSEQFYVVNTHFDHQSTNAREKSAELIKEKIKEFDAELPVLLTGDFNTGPDSVPHQSLTTEGAFDDLWDTAEVRINESLGTFNGFHDQTGGGQARRIDWVLGKGNVETHSIEIINEYKNGQFPSDHFPVLADVTLSYE